jgi:ATP-binding cassette subfamily B protein
MFAFLSTRMRRPRRYPEVLQNDASDCVPGGDDPLLRTPGRLARLRDLANVDRNGATLWSVSRAAEALGLHARGPQLDYECLADVHLPASALGEQAYVVLFEVGRDQVVVGDPAIGRR